MEESYCYVCVTTIINVLTIRSKKLVIILVNSKVLITLLITIVNPNYRYQTTKFNNNNSIIYFGKYL